MRYFALTILITLSAVSPCQAQDTCRLPDGTLWACADGGQLRHVFPESTVTRTVAEGCALTAIHFEKACERYGWAGGITPRGDPFIMRTIDAGKNWVPIHLPCLPPDKDNRPVRIHSYRAYVVMVLLANGTQLRSFDSGCTFDQMMRPVEGYSIEEAKKRYEEAVEKFK